MFHRDSIIVLLKCLNSVFRVTFADLAAVNLLQTFESAVEENVSIKGQAWQEATDHCLMGMCLTLPLSLISQVVFAANFILNAIL